MSEQTNYGVPMEGTSITEIPMDNEVPMTEIPMDEVPMAEVSMTETPINEEPVDKVPMSGAPVNGVPMNGAPVNGVPMNGAPVNGMPMNGAPMNGMPMNGMPINGMPINGMPMNGMPMNGMSPYGNPMYRKPVEFVMEPMPKSGNGPSLLECRNLSKCYLTGVPALNHLNLRIEKGHIVGLLGPNGSGKTTLIKIINGLLTPTEGEVLINGSQPGPYSKSVVSYLPERTYLEAQKDVRSLVAFFADFYEDFHADRAYAMLQALGIPSDARLKTLSKGTKEKVQLILVMSRDAQLYILDEPIAGVDPAARDYIIRTILSNYNPNATLLICTHLISDIENILDDIIFIRRGEVVVQSTVDNIRERFGKTVDAYFREVFAC